MNLVVLKGNLSKDITLTNGSTTIAKTSIAVQRMREGTDFINIVAFGKTAEFMDKYFKKGSPALIQGRIQTGSYTNREGNKVSTVDVVVENIEFCGSAKGTSAKKDDEFMSIPDGLEDDGIPFDV